MRTRTAGTENHFVIINPNLTPTICAVILKESFVPSINTPIIIRFTNLSVSLFSLFIHAFVYFKLVYMSTILTFSVSLFSLCKYNNKSSIPYLPTYRSLFIPIYICIYLKLFLSQSFPIYLCSYLSMSVYSYIAVSIYLK